MACGYGVGAGTLKTSVRIAASASGRRPRFCHFSNSTCASFASVAPRDGPAVRETEELPGKVEVEDDLDNAE